MIDAITSKLPSMYSQLALAVLFTPLQVAMKTLDRGVNGGSDQCYGIHDDK